MVTVILVTLYFLNIPGYSATVDSAIPRVLNIYFFVPAVFLALAPHVLSLRYPGGHALEPLILWAALYMVVGAVWFVLVGPADAEDLVRQRMVAMATMVGFFLLFCDSRAVGAARMAIACAVVIGAVLCVLDFAVPSVFVPPEYEFSTPGRGAAFYVNANRAGSALALGATLCLAIVPLSWRGGFIALTTIGIVATVSRAAFLAWILSLALLFFLKVVRGRDLLAGGLIASVVGGAGLLWLWSEGVSLDSLDLIRERLHWLTTLGDSEEQSASSRGRLMELAFSAIEARPIFGNGLLGTFRWDQQSSTHNIYLRLWVEHGIVGLFLYPGLLAVLILRSFSGVPARHTVYAMCVLFAFFGLFSHNVLEESAFLITYALCAAMGSGPLVRQWTLPSSLASGAN